MTIKTFTKSLAGGEITPELFGRVDLAKYQTGLKTVRNFVILPHGPAANRPGFEYVIETKDSTKASRLIEFIYSSSQSIVIEFGDQYVRFHTQGGTVLESSQSITSATNASPGVFSKVGHGYTTGQWIYWTGVTGMSQLNARYMKVVVLTADTFSLTDLAGTAFDTTSLGTFTAGNAARVYEIASPYLEADLFDLHFTQSADVMTIVHTGYQQRELRRTAATSWAFSTLAFAPTISAPAAPTVSASGAGAETNTYVTTAIASDGLEESVASASTPVTGVALATAGAFNTITPAAVSGAVRYNVYKYKSGLYGYIGQTNGAAFKDDNITADTSKTPPENDDPFGSAGNYPGAVGYFEGRRWFAGTANKPQNVWATRSGTEKNMSYSIPTRDDDRIAIRLIARQANTIRHIMPISDLLLLTSGSEWKITAQNSDTITPTTISYRPEDYIGASMVQPVLTNGAILYAQDRGGRIREMKYNWEQQGYPTEDISILSPHLFDGYTIKQMSYSRAPFSTVWAVRSDGTLLGLTYVPKHEVAAWHHHDTDGTFESVCVVPEGTEDATYCIVKRNVNGRDVRYIERLHSRRFSTSADCFFVDAGVTYSGSATTTVSTGLWHLIGEEVAILADGAVMSNATVSASGTITLPVAASKVHIGLPIEADLETLPLSYEAQAFGQGTYKNINKVHLRVNESSGVFAGPSFDKLIELKQRTNENYGTPPSLITDEVSIALTPTWAKSGTLCIRQSNPLPLTLLSMTLEVAVG